MSKKILVADSGSTKTDWCLFDETAHKEEACTVGLNPYYISANDLLRVLKEELMLLRSIHQPDEIYFYGSGCSLPDKQLLLKVSLEEVFPHAKVRVEHDLLGAARALCGSEPGIACILGTGSNACFYDGTHITKEAISLGFWLGDEGGAGFLGKQLLTDFAYGKLQNTPLHAYLEGQGLNRQRILELAYHTPMPNVQFAQHAQTLSVFRNESYSQALLQTAFQQFLTNHILAFGSTENIPLNFTGSIAEFFAPELGIAVQSMGLKMGKIVRKPIHGLVAYHQEKASI
ncbi:MAG: N-acetylglucosamine kinase [Cytophagales bacterium]|nr:MAG: N-acetylglucosamine kinase [Cytophagales bacterium]TAF61685.1 MAG: N-acetylglucosamine kinase [Cytophagales bacterium]